MDPNVSQTLAGTHVRELPQDLAAGAHEDEGVDAKRAEEQSINIDKSRHKMQGTTEALSDWKGDVV